MAASTSWRTSLSTHSIFDSLREYVDDRNNNNDSRRLMVVQDGELFVWNPHTACVLTTDLKFLQQNPEQHSFQKLLCSNSPVYDVERILFNETGNCLALVGQRGVSVMHLPQRWGKNALFEGGKQRVTAKTTPVGDRFFTCQLRMKVLDVTWHPGSPGSTHLAILTSDNVVRVYDIEENPQQASHTFPLSEQLSLGSSGLSTAQALGDQAVAMAFAPPTELQPKSSNQESVLIWPLYLLWANGDIYQLYTSIRDIKGFKPNLVGPLSMYPPAEDNYGSDACSLLRVGSSPPVLVIATPSGKLYHCVVLPRSTDQDTDSHVSWPTEVSGDFLPPEENTLYCYESVELELSLATVAIETNEVLLDDFTCPIRLHNDDSCLERYHCSHGAGVHSVLLPWLNKFQRFSDQDELETLTDTEQAIVEHLVCTKPLASSPPSPILGLSVTADRLLGPTLLALTSDFDCLTLPLLSHYYGDAPALLSETPGKKIESPLRKLHREPFDSHIMRILQKSSSNPRLKGSDKTELSSQECFQLLTRATQVFREEYLQKHDMASQEIQRRVRVLKEQKAQQFDDLKDLEQQRNILTEKAHQLAERYEDTAELQALLIKRIATVLRKLQAKMPMLSQAERKMHRELKDIDDRLQHYSTRIQEVKLKRDYQSNQMKLDEDSQNRSMSSSRKPSRDLSLSKPQTENLYSILKQESDQISDLMKQVKSVKLQMT